MLIEKKVSYKEWLELMPLEWIEKIELEFADIKKRIISIKGNTFIILPEEFEWEENENTCTLRTDNLYMKVWKFSSCWQMGVFNK